jgi:hypothetical protein
MEHRRNETGRENPVPVPLCPPQILHALTWDRTRASALGGRRLTTWAMARPCLDYGFMCSKIRKRVTISGIIYLLMFYNAKCCYWRVCWFVSVMLYQLVKQLLSMILNKDYEIWKIRTKFYSEKYNRRNHLEDRRRWENYIKLNLKEILCVRVCVNWIRFIRNRDQWRKLVKMMISSCCIKRREFPGFCRD